MGWGRVTGIAGVVLILILLGLGCGVFTGLGITSDAITAT